jgi:hypothetical protein
MPAVQLLRVRPDGRWPVMASLRPYTAREKAIRAADAGGIRQRWEFGRLLVVDDTATTPAGNLRNGVLDTLVQAARKAGWSPRIANSEFTIQGLRRDIQYRMQCARSYPCESQIRQASADFESWTALAKAGFPPYPREPGERPYDPRSDADIADATGKFGAEILPDGFEQMALFGRFTDDTTLAEMQRYCSAQAEMTARFSERDDKRQRYLNSLIKAVDGDLAATWAEARAALVGQDGGDGGA